MTVFYTTTLGSTRLSSRGADPTRQPISLCPLLFICYRLRCRPLMDRDRCTRITPRHHP